MPKKEKEGQPLLTKDMREYQRLYRIKYYNKNIESERKRQRDYYHNVVKLKNRNKRYNIPMQQDRPPSRKYVKTDDKINCLSKKNGKFKITFD